jgi:hypothetical protein
MFSPPHATEAEGPQPAATVLICHSLSRRRPWRPAPLRRRPWWPFLSRRQRSLSFPYGGASSLPMDSAAIPSLPPQWWWWQQAVSPLPPMVAVAGTLPSRGSRSSSHGASKGLWRGAECGCDVLDGIMSLLAGRSAPPASSTSMNFKCRRASISSKEQRDVALKMHVASVHFKCLRCFRGMLQLFHMDVAKADRDVAYVAIVVHACCKLLFSMFHLFFSDGCCECVYLDVAYVSHICCKFLPGCCVCFAMFFQVLCFCKCFRSTFQVFHLS